MPTYVSDTETFPNFHCQNYEDIETGKRFYFEISNRRNDLQRLIPFYLNPNAQFIGFNFVGYDNLLISSVIMSGRGLTNAEIKAVSDAIITSENKKFVKALNKTN